MENFSTSLSALKERKGAVIAIIAVILVPLIYAALILSASWGPYDNLSNLPVAVVNNDAGAMSGDEEVNVGNQLVDSLKKSMTLGFKFVSSEEAKKGMEDLTYYMTIEIPEDFSQRVTTVLEENPQIPELTYTQNEGLHFMAAQVTNKAAEQIREQLGNQITETYVRNVFTQLEQVAAGFQDGAEGSTKINEGSVKLKGGTGQILSSLETKAPDISKLADGAKELKAGTGELATKIQGGTAGVNQLADGSKTLAAGFKPFSDGTNQLNAGILAAKSGAFKLAKGSNDLSKGLNDANNGAITLNNGMKELKAGTNGVLEGLQGVQGKLPELIEGTKSIAAGLGEAKTSVETLLEPGARQVADGVKQLSKHPILGPVLLADKDFQRLLEGSEALANGMTLYKNKTAPLAPGAQRIANGLDAEDPKTLDIKGAVDQLVAGSDKLDKGAKALLDGSGALANGTSRLAAGAGEIAKGNSDLAAGTGELATGSGKIVAGANELAAGAKKVADGNGTLQSSWTALSNGAQKINNGMAQVSEGNQTVNTGWGTLTDGVKQVDNGIGQIESGSKELADGLKGGAEKVGAIRADDSNIAQFASPVALKQNVLNSFPMYRYANAPYVLALALFVGVLVMTVVFNMRKPDTQEVSSFTWYSSLFSKMAGVAVLQAVIASVCTLFFLKLSAYHSILLVIFAIIASLAFLSIVFFLVAAAGNIGRFIAFVFLVLQLSTTGSSLPIAMLPEGLRTLSTFLPMRYAIDSFRSIISLDNAGAGWANAFVLLFFLISGLALAAVVVFFQNKRSNTATPARVA
ncbi:YhgE/Pip family protein [Bacillus sp. EB01]|uniref:YhgE/Pip family protein n=1 Tax=Bacillus sp. EB01 TaxID=1347086 RepID=UPI0005C515EF|nr:YhgE/Pip domain-containing protein [Bacillus sp. EB01]